MISSKNTLRSIKIEDYYKAKTMPRLLFVEGNTDIEILRALAEKLKHKSFDLLSDRLNCYYIQDNHPDDDLHSRLGRAERKDCDSFKSHFYTLRRVVEELKGVALLDNDNQNKADENDDILGVYYWKHYELENYFLTPEIILQFIADYYDVEDVLFKSAYYQSAEKIIDLLLITKVFEGKDELLDAYKKANKSVKHALLKSIKMSTFTEDFFERFAKEQNQPVLIRKGEYWKLVKYVDAKNISNEITEKLDILVTYLSLS